MPAELQPVSVLLIDRNDISRAGLKAVLSEDPRFALVGDTAVDGASLARRLRPQLILLEPENHGQLDLSLITELQTTAPESCLCVYTAFFEPRPFLDAMLVGVRAYLLKGTASGTLLLDALWLTGRFNAAVIDAAIVDGFREKAATRLILIEPEGESPSLTHREREVLRAR